MNPNELIRNDVVSGLWKFDVFNFPICINDLLDFAQEWMDKEPDRFLFLYVRKCSTQQFGISFVYVLDGPDYKKSRTKFFHKMEDKLKKRFGRALVGHDIGHPTWIINPMVREQQKDDGLYTRILPGAEELPVGPTDGKETIVGATDLFTAGIDPDFKNWGCDVTGQPTSQVKVAIHEIIKSGKLSQIFSVDSVDDLDKLCFQQSQITQFLKSYRQWLQTDGYGTFFLFKANGESFLAGVNVCFGGQLSTRVHRFSCASVWGAGHNRRFVVPLTL